MDHRGDHCSTSWSISDTNLLIPVGDSVDRESDSGNVDITDNVIAPTLVIGLDKSFFDQNPSTKDVILIQNPTLKLGCEIKSSNYISENGSYIISFVESDKLSNDINKKQNCELPVVYNSNLCDNILTDDPFQNADAKNIFISDLSSALTGKTDFDKKSDTLSLDANADIENSLPTSLVQKKELNQDDPKRVFDATGKTTMPEKSLPLKKKAKMKRNEENCDNTNGTFLPLEPGAPNGCEQTKIKRVKGRQGGRRKCCYSESELSDVEDEGGGQDGVEIMQFKNIRELVEDITKRGHFDDDFAELVLRGIAEMKVDILQEMQTPVSSEGESHFSYELLTFAFLLYFKRRSAYVYMGAGLKHRWPSVAELTKWKNLVNSMPKKGRKSRKRVKANS